MNVYHLIIIMCLCFHLFNKYSAIAYDVITVLGVWEVALKRTTFTTFMEFTFYLELREEERYKK